MEILKSVTAGMQSIPVETFLLLLATALLIGFLNMLVFRVRSRQSAGFSLTLILLPVAVTVVIMLVNNQLGAGIAVAGAFSLVRYRSIPGTAKEIAAVFICVVLGLALGMGYIAVAVILFVFTALVVLAGALVPSLNNKSFHRQMRITIPENLDYNGLFDPVFERYGVRASLTRVKSTAMGTLFELTYDLALPSEQVPKAFLDDLRILNLNQTIVIGLLPEDGL